MLKCATKVQRETGHQITRRVFAFRSVGHCVYAIIRIVTFFFLYASFMAIPQSLKSCIPLFCIHLYSCAHGIRSTHSSTVWCETWRCDSFVSSGTSEYDQLPNQPSSIGPPQNKRWWISMMPVDQT